MLGRKDYTREEFDHGKTAIDSQLAAYRQLAVALDNDTVEEKVRSAQEDFEAQFFNTLVLALDRWYVHRLRGVTGKDGNPLNEVELIVESLMNNGGFFRGNNVVKYVPEQSVVKLKPGDKIRLTADDFERLSAAFFQDLERKYVP
jgi:hypothetical protein